MADSKTTTLTELTTPGATDVLVIVDNSGTPTTKKIQYSNLKPTKTFSIPFTIVNGAGESTTNTSYDDMAYYKIPFDKTMFPNATSIKLQVLLQQDNSGSYQIWCELKTTAGTVITGSEVTATLGQYATSVQTSGDLTAYLTNGPESYQLLGKTAASGKCDIQGAAIIVNMSV